MRRITALMLCLAMLMTMLPVTAVPASSLENHPCDCGYIGDAGLAAHADGCSRKSYIRHTYIVDNSAEAIYAQWGAMDEETREAILTFLSWDNYTKYTQLNALIANGEAAPEDKPLVYLNGEEVSAVNMPQYEKPTLSAVSTVSGSVSYRWQILADVQAQLWVDIYGEREADLTLSYGMVATLLDDNSQAWVRCVTTTADGEAVGEAICVTMEPYTEYDNSVTDYPVETLVVVPENAQPVPETTVATETTEVTEATEVTGATEETTMPSAADPTVAETVGELVNAPMADMSVLNDRILSASRVARRSGSGVSVASTTTDETTDETTGETTPTGDTTIYSILIQYLFENGSTAATPYTSTVGATTILNTTVEFPKVQGYAPYVNGSRQDSYTFDNVQLTEDFTLVVTYLPALVDYKVHVYQQNVSDDGYTLKESVTSQAYTGSTTYEFDESEMTYPGFYKLLYDKPAIAADGSTEVYIYYGREYYLVTFDLDGGYGVLPVYARYGTSLNIPNPTRAGYTFLGWDLLDANGNGDGVVDAAPTMVDVGGGAYKALWKAASETTDITVIFWGENPDDDRYSAISTKEMEVESGAAVSYDPSSDSICGIENHNHDDSCLVGGSDLDTKIWTYERADSSVVAEPGGSSILNVYFTRKEYTLKFYYAASQTEDSTTTYRVVGGSTYYFGSLAGVSDKTDEKALLQQYFSDSGSYLNLTGVVDEPTLNDTGKARQYVEGTTAGIDNYTYHYIAFTAKYGANIYDLWPNGVFNSVKCYDAAWASSDIAHVSAWNGEHHVYYSQHNGNETIKGKYSVLDDNLLWDYAKFNAYADDEDDDGVGETIAFLCFWENGANVSWSIPELYRYSIFIEPIDENTTSTGRTEVCNVNGKTYYWAESYDTVDDSEVSQQTYPEIPGLNPVEGYVPSVYQSKPLTAGTDYDTSQYSAGFEVFFFYDRATYDLTFHNVNKTTKEEIVKYGAPLSAYNDYVPDIPTDENGVPLYEAGTYQFVGWYDNQAFNGDPVDLSTMTMPSENLMLYAKWEPVLHDVTIYRFKNDDGTYPEVNEDDPLNDDVLVETISVPHGSFIQDQHIPEDPSHGSYDFAGWFYVDKNGQEQAFVFEDIPITQDMKIYAKWSSKVLKRYTIRYLKADGSGQVTGDTVWVADLTEGSGLAGTTKTFYALGADDLYPEFQEGWFPTTTSHSFTLDIDGENTYDFLYVQKDTVPYTVHYYKADADGNLIQENGAYVSVSPSKTVSDNRKAIVTENFVQVSGYMPDAFQKTLIVNGADGAENVIIFKYVEDSEHGPLKISHYIQNLDDTTWTEYAGYESVGSFGTYYEESTMEIPGFTYNEGLSNPSGTLEKTAGGLHLKLYYTRNSYPYMVRYLEQGTGNVLAPAQTFTGDNMALFGSVVRADAKDIPGYTCVSDAAQSITIRIEGNLTNPQNNIITFYYRENEVTLEYKVAGEGGKVSRDSETVAVFSGAPLGAAPAADTGYVFVGWFEDENCTTPVNSAWLENDYLHPQQTKAADAQYYADIYYAKFEKLLTVNYEAVGNGSVSITSQTIRESETFAGSLATPSNHDYKFVGWYSEKDCINLVDSELHFTPQNTDDGKTFYAKFDLIAGDLQITKTVINNTLDSIGGQEFEFTIMSGETDGILTGTYTLEISDAVGTETAAITAVDGALTLKLESGQTALIRDLLPGTYHVAETPIFGYKSELTTDTVEIVDDGTAEVECTNIYPVYTGNLEITKTVSKKYVNDVLPDDTFSFTITLNPDSQAFDKGRTYAYTIEVTRSTGTVILGQGIIDDANDAITFEMFNGDVVTVYDLPVGGYTVTEADHADYITQEPIEGDIVAGETVAAEFENIYTRHRGDLIIQKTVTKEYDADTWTGDTFEFHVAGETTMADGTYTIQIDEKNEDVTVVNGKFTLTLPLTIDAVDVARTISIKDLPVGTYTITETPKDAYKTTINGVEVDNASSVVRVSAVTVDNAAATAAFVNEYKRTTGTLCISKVITIVEGSGETIDPNEEFTFTVSMPEDGNFVGETYGVSGHNTIKEVTVGEDGTFSFKLKHGESVEILLPVGSYVVREAPASGYASSFPVPSADGSAQETVLVKTGDKAELNCVNTFPVHYGDLIITKTVTSESKLDTPPDIDFLFQVQLASEHVNKSYNAVFTLQDGTSETRTVTSNASAVVTVQLKNGESVQFEQLPEGECLVTEVLDASGDFTPSYLVNTEESENGSLVIGSGTVNTIAVTNLYQSRRASLTITKGNASDQEQVFVYEVKNVATGEIVTVTVTGNGSITICDLPYGDYTVTQQNDWSWRYEDSAKNVTLDENDKQNGETVAFTDPVTKNSWLDGSSWLIKNRKKGDS